MKKYWITLCLFGSLLPQLSFAQDKSVDEAAVVTIVQQLFDAMRAGDSAAMRPLFDPSARLQTTYTDKEGKAQMRGDGIDLFIKSIGTPHEEVYDEQIFSYRTEIDDRLASVWTDYTFYVGDRLSHCGVNAFQLFKSDAGWKIIQITDTRRKKDCQEDPVRQIHHLMDGWHYAAATADEDLFFGSMTEDAIYLGTDDSERWLRDELKEWSKKYFEREEAWAFQPSDREIYFSADRQTAWFEERLGTWMGPCRGSGVVRKMEGTWKICHYNLAVTVPNDKIEAFKKAMEN